MSGRFTRLVRHRPTPKPSCRVRRSGHRNPLEPPCQLRQRDASDFSDCAYKGDNHRAQPRSAAAISGRQAHFRSEYLATRYATGRRSTRIRATIGSVSRRKHPAPDRATEEEA